MLRLASSTLFPTRRSSDLQVEDTWKSPMWCAMKLARGEKMVRSLPRSFIFLSWLASMLSRSSSSRSEEHTSELQSRPHLVCRLLLEKKNRYRLSQNTERID